MSQDDQGKPPGTGPAPQKTMMGYAPVGGLGPKPWGEAAAPAAQAPQAAPPAQAYAPQAYAQPAAQAAPPAQAYAPQAYAQPAPQAAPPAQAYAAQAYAQPAAPAAQAAPDGAQVYPLHAGARSAYMVVGVLLCLLVISLPIAIWVFLVRARGRLEVRGPELRAFGFFSRRFDLREATRLGVLEVPIYARGIGGALARRKVGGSHGVHLCMIDGRGKKQTMLLSVFEGYQAVIPHAQAGTGLRLETVTVGALGPKWPEA